MLLCQTGTLVIALPSPSVILRRLAGRAELARLAAVAVVQLFALGTPTILELQLACAGIPIRRRLPVAGAQRHARVVRRRQRAHGGRGHGNRRRQQADEHGVDKAVAGPHRL